MPAVRRTPSDDTRLREQELKRSRGELACAECTRLKLRCNKKLPCSSCVRRGCSSICPNGALTGGQGTRLVLADTEQLHRKLTEMRERIRQLEDALLLATSRWPEPHPLLSDELLSIKCGYDSCPAENPDNIHEDDLTNEFGTLTLSDDGSARFIGSTGASHFQSLLEADTQFEKQTYNEQSYATEVGKQSRASHSKDELDKLHRLVQAKESLPPYERAWTLCETYLEQASWVVRFVQRQQLIDELLIPIYNNKPNTAPDTTGSQIGVDLTSTHDLALLLMVFATGSLFDLTLPPDNDQAYEFYERACRLVSMDSVAHSPSVIATQTIAQMGIFVLLSNRGESVEKAFTFLNFAHSLGASLGLHRDPERWNLKNEAVQRRRRIFWQLFLCSNFQCISNGRPVLYNSSFIDTRFPDDCDQIIDLDGSMTMDNTHWKFRFAREVVYEVNKLTCTVRPVRYSQILDINRIIRAFDFPNFLHIPTEGLQWNSHGAYSIMQRITAAIRREWLLIHVNRSYFARALMEFPLDPMKSPFASSLLTSYRSALTIVKVIKDQFGVCQSYFIRNKGLWRYVFSSLVVIGALVVRSPKSNLAHAALIQLTLGVMFFENVTFQAKWEKHELNILLRLRRKALQVFTLQRSGQSSHEDVTVMPSDGERLWVDDLSILADQMRSTKNASMTKSVPEVITRPTCSGSMSAFVSDASPTQPPSSSGPHSPPLNAAGHDNSVPKVLSQHDLALFLAAASSFSERLPISYPDSSAGTVPPPLKASQTNERENNILMAYEESIAPVSNSELYDVPVKDMSWADTPDVDFATNEMWATFLQDSGVTTVQSDITKPS
ncbi:hypothetical protein BD410DRAFT_743893 [Rickenella mellea]|uniref:Zn(2)-C6 fungal-type domain-containing protein n=1 Tax=Rickenella mellea TaxID=50990 RepID=A0A4Y7QE65_9AGAM|nr:hypothetical protein BD410DRAFT_743893 [Rickenella mellea]